MVSLRHDEASRRYVLAAQPAFEAAQEAATRLAGLLITAELGRSRHLLDLPSREAAYARLAEAREHHARLVPSGLALHFHHHLSRAIERLEAAFTAADAERAGRLGAPDPLPPLRAAWADMEAASRSLPGFETIDFKRSCCAMHRQEPTTTDLGGTHVGLFDLDS